MKGRAPSSHLMAFLVEDRPEVSLCQLKTSEDLHVVTLDVFPGHLKKELMSCAGFFLLSFHTCVSMHCICSVLEVSRHREYISEQNR
jgi:hypothetical protein